MLLTLTQANGMLNIIVEDTMTTDWMLVCKKFKLVFYRIKWKQLGGIYFLDKTGQPIVPAYSVDILFRAAPMLYQIKDRDGCYQEHYSGLKYCYQWHLRQEIPMPKSAPTFQPRFCRPNAQAHRPDSQL